METLSILLTTALLLLGAILLLVGWIASWQHKDIRRAKVMTCAAAEHAVFSLPVSAGPVAPEHVDQVQQMELLSISGRALPEPAVRTAPFSGRPCVWYKAIATVKEGGDKREFHKQTSEEPFALSDGTGRVMVYPPGYVHFAEHTVDEKSTGPYGALPAAPESSSTPTLTSSEVKLEADHRPYHYQEWIVPPGAELVVIGSRAGAPGLTAKMIGLGGAKRLALRTRRLMVLGYGVGTLLLLLSVPFYVFMDYLD